MFSGVWRSVDDDVVTQMSTLGLTQELGKDLTSESRKASASE